MKHIYKIMVIAFAALSFIGCKSDLLDLAPYDSVSSGNMWTTESLTDQGVIGAYDFLYASYCGLYPYNYEYLSPMMQPRGVDGLLAGTATAGFGYYAWEYLYEGVSRTNDCIANVPNAQGVSGTKKARLVAECKFLRAWYYMYLNMLFNGVPIYTEPTDLDDLTKGRNTEAEVWDVVLSDLTDAINEVSLPDKYAAGNSDYGRITKGAAYALRARVYLWLKEWSKAEADFRAVGTCGYSLYKGSYKSLFKEANEQCDEMIFSVQCIGVSGYGNDLSFRYGSRSSFGSCWNNYYPSTDFVDTYQNADGSEFNWDDYIPGYNDMPTEKRRVFFLRDDMTDSEKSAMKAAGADMDKYLSSGNEARIKAVYEKRDPRLIQTIITPYSTYLGAISATDQEFTLRWPYRKDTSDPFDIRTDDNSRFYYLYRKFVAEGASEIPNRSYSPIDVPMIRYAEVVLGLAEALNEQGKTEEAIPYVNMVRARAGVAELNSNENTQVSGQEDLRAKIRQERRWELNGEGIDYFDELRWGTWKDQKFFEGAGTKQMWGTATFKYNYAGDYIQKWPIPASECEKNTNLIQNDGWIN